MTFGIDPGRCSIFRCPRVLALVAEEFGVTVEPDVRSQRFESSEGPVKVLSDPLVGWIPGDAVDSLAGVALRIRRSIRSSNACRDSRNSPANLRPFSA